MSALSLGLSGAKLGGQLGGAWGAIGGGLLGIALGGRAQKKEKAMIDKFNAQVTKFAAQDLFDLQRQQNVENIRTAQALMSYQSTSDVTKSAATAAMGAADIIGSSADALKQTMDFQSKAAMAETLINWETGIENYNTMIDSMTNQRAGQYQRQMQTPPEDIGAIISGGVGVYNDFIKGQGQNILDDAQFAWQNRDQYANLIKNEAKLQATSLMGQLSTVWADNKAAFKEYTKERSGARNLSIINQGVLDSATLEREHGMRTYGLGR